MTREEYLSSTQAEVQLLQEEYYEARREQEVFTAHLFACTINMIVGMFAQKYEPINAYTLCPWLERESEDGE